MFQEVSFTSCDLSPPQVAGLDGGAGRARAARGRHAAGAPPCAPNTYFALNEAMHPCMHRCGNLLCTCAVALSTGHVSDACGRRKFSATTVLIVPVGSPSPA